MPSRSSSAHIIGALLTALGLATVLTGLVQSSTTEQAVGLGIATAGSILLFQRAAQASASLRKIQEHDAEIEGKAFGLALKMVRDGELTPLPRSTDTLTDTGGRRYDL